MLRFSAVRTTALFLLTIAPAAFLGCAGGGEGGGGPGECDALLATADQALEDELARLSDLEDPNPGEVDFTEAQAAYDAALACDPDNPDAQFGAGLTKFLALSQNPEISDAFDDFAALIDTSVIAGAPAAPGGLVAPELGGIGSRIEAPSLAAWPLARGFLGLPMAAMLNPGPIEDLQNAIETIALPLVDAAIGLLDLVASDPDFTFIITPEMQGDPTADPAELDLTEVYVALTALNAVRTFAGLAVSYSFDVASLDSAGVHQALIQDSGFLALRPNGAELMADSHAHLLTVVDRLVDAIEYLVNETDPQDDDIIVTDPVEGPTEPELVDLRQDLLDLRADLSGPIDVYDDFDGDGTYETVVVNFAAFMTAAPQNLKALLPAYTVEVLVDGEDLCPAITWDADTFADWTFPDPTWGGLFPGIASSDDFKMTFGIDEFEPEWQKTEYLCDNPPVARTAAR